MKNLENFGVSELRIDELEEISGGDIFTTFLLIGAVIMGIGLIANNNVNGPGGPGSNGPQTSQYKDY